MHCVSRSTAIVLAMFLRGGAPPPPLIGQDPTQDPGQGASEEALAAVFQAAGLRLDREAGVVAIPAGVLVTNDLIEYLLVGEAGATHESLLTTSVRPSLINAALLALGVQPGTNARWKDIDPGTRVSERQGEREALEVQLPEGDGFYLYVAWREDGETYFFRADDLVCNLEQERSLRRHRWVYLGSRFARLRKDEAERFVADLEGNLINLTFFFEGNTLVTAALSECLAQAVWVANRYLLPPRGAQVLFLFARESLERLPDSLAEALPSVDRGELQAQAERGGR